MALIRSEQQKRLDAAFNLEPVDRPPALGGWIADPAKILALAGVTEDEYWDNPIPISVEAYKKLYLDGLLDINVPGERGSYTLVTSHDFKERNSHTPEDLVALVDSLPTPEELEASFNEEAAYDEKVAELKQFQDMCGDKMYWCPARWEVIPNFEWYRSHGYETYLLALCMYQDKMIELFRRDAARAKCQARVVARMVREGLQPKGMLCGMDICGQSGPLVDPGFLREHYFPLVKETIQPLRDVGARLIWHCDGDIRPILDDLLGLGLGGLQGFQEECGVRVEELAERRTIDGEKLIILGPISVTKTLVEEDPEGVKEAVRNAIRVCENQASLVLFTSNELLPDVSLENMTAMYEVLKEYE